jgi:hypothetical protein
MATPAVAGIRVGTAFASRRDPRHNRGMSRQDRIRERAYQLWEQAGRPSGRDLEFWARAEAELLLAAPAAPAPPPPVVAPPAVVMVQPPRSPGERAILGALLACFVLALAGVAAWATVSRLDARQALELERFKAEGQLALDQRKLETQLLLDAARGGDAETVARNLRFLIAAGLLDDRDHKIAALAAAGQVPVVAAPPPPQEPEAGNVNARRITENGSDFVVSSRASPEGDRTIFTYRVTNNGAREETVDWGDILHATIAPGRSASIVKSAAGAARSAATFFQWGPTAKTLVYAFVPSPAGASPQDQPAP